MGNLLIGVGYASLRFRQSRSLKDKRHIMRSITQKLRNLGFSAAECDYADNPKQGSIGFSFVGTRSSGVKKALDEASRLFVGDFEVLRTCSDIVDFSTDLELSLEDGRDGEMPWGGEE